MPHSQSIVSEMCLDDTLYQKTYLYHSHARNHWKKDGEIDALWVKVH
jgi:hypothetical protein